MAEEQKTTGTTGTTGTTTGKDWEKDVVETAGDVAEKAARFSLDVMTLPLSLLPGKSREHANRAFGEFAMAFMSASREFAESAEKFVERVAESKKEAKKEAKKEGGPSAEGDVREKAESFSERVAGTAEGYKKDKE